jgi:hypothetical protein
MDIDVGTTEKDDPAEVAMNGFDAMRKGEGDVAFENRFRHSLRNPSRLA